MSQQPVGVDGKEPRQFRDITATGPGDPALVGDQPGP